MPGHAVHKSQLHHFFAKSKAQPQVRLKWERDQNLCEKAIIKVVIQWRVDNTCMHADPTSDCILVTIANV